MRSAVVPLTSLGPTRRPEFRGFRLTRAELDAGLDGAGLRLERSLVGSYITSLEMAGLSITLLRLDDELTRLWDAPVHTPALRWGT